MKKGCSAALALTAALCAGRSLAQEQLRFPSPVPDNPAPAAKGNPPAAKGNVSAADPVLPVGVPAQTVPENTPELLEIWDHAMGWTTITPPHLWPRHDMGLHDSCGNSCRADAEYLLVDGSPSARPGHCWIVYRPAGGSGAARHLGRSGRPRRRPEIFSGAFHHWQLAGPARSPGCRREPLPGSRSFDSPIVRPQDLGPPPCWAGLSSIRLPDSRPSSRCRSQ